ncbi:MAG: DUF6544 family protein [Ornithinibacter sp.]
MKPATLDPAAAWKALSMSTPPAGVFDPDDLVDLPLPARRLLANALSPGVELTPTVILQMEGEIRLKRWVPFRARQVLRAGSGFAWRATAGRTPVVFTGGDTYWLGRGSLDFRLWGLIPVVRAAGRDIDRSAAGRLAAETVAWAPQALTPQMGAVWTGLDESRAVVTLPAGEETTDVTVTVDTQGRLVDLSTRRWGDPVPGEFGLVPFGGGVTELTDFGGIRIATAGRVGWWWGTDRQPEGEFFHYRIRVARFPSASDPS